MNKMNGCDLPRWIDLHGGIRVFARPRSAAEEAARELGILRVRYLQAHKGLAALNDDELEGWTRQVWAESLALASIVEWEGVHQKDGLPYRISGESVRELMAIPGMADAFLCAMGDYSICK